MVEKLGDGEYRAQGGGGRGRVDRGALADARLDAPLPWDHIDTGIQKWWLKADLQKALEGITVGPCSLSLFASTSSCFVPETKAKSSHSQVIPCSTTIMLKSR